MIICLILEKRKIIINIFKSLNYDALPNLSSLENHNINENITIYRGISAKNNELLKKYIEDFINGEIFLGGRNDCGVIIESKLSNNTKIIEKEKLEIIIKFLIEQLEEYIESQPKKFEELNAYESYIFLLAKEKLHNLNQDKVREQIKIEQTRRANNLIKGLIRDYDHNF